MTLNGQQKKTQQGTQERLEEELKRLKARVGLAGHLRVVWMPNTHSSLSGEVKGSDILIYEEQLNKALNVLRHEFLDYIVSHAIEPYKDVTNRLIKMINEDAYRRKERVVDALTKLIEKDGLLEES